MGVTGDYNHSFKTELDYVGYSQDPHRASREFLHGLQEDEILNIIDSKLNIEFNVAGIRQDPNRSNFEVADNCLQCNANILAEKMAKY